MKKRLLSLLLTVLLLLTGCHQAVPEDTTAATVPQTEEPWYIPYESMEYIRPELADLQTCFDGVRDALAGDSPRAIMNAVYDFYDAYDWYYTCYSLADIRYSGDLTDSYWEAEYNHCVENSGAVEAMLEDLYYLLAGSDWRETLESPKYFGDGFFDGYEGENPWDAEFTRMMEEEAALVNRYYALTEENFAYEMGTVEYYDACADGMAQLLVDLIALRQQMAAYWGYDSYPEFASDFYHYRDYTVSEMEAYLAAIARELVPVYRNMNASDVWYAAGAFSSESQTFRAVRKAAKNMGGTVWEAFQLMEDAGLYDIAWGENKYTASFEVFLTSYGEPFVFMNPELVVYDRLTLAHEFGHFCNDYACYGSYAGVDVLEFFSQGMEYLFLCYGEDTELLTQVKLADSLSVYVEQAAYASFENRMYSLTSGDLTVQSLYDLYDEVALTYGFDSLGYDAREFVDVVHLYTNPMYLPSYIVSNDAAMQLYQLELQEPGAGLELMEANLSSQEVWFLSFLESAGLESPFGEERLRTVREIFEAVFD